MSDRGGDLGDVYRVFITPRGLPGAPQLISTLSSDGDENKISISHDGLKAFISHDNGGDGDYSTYMSTRRSTRDEWSVPKLIIPDFGLATALFDERRLYLTAPGVEDPTVAAIYTSTRVHAGSMQDKVAESRGALPLDAFAGRTAR